MATVNKRVKAPQAITINGVAAGGAMTASIQAGFDNPMRSLPDGLQLPVKDKEVQFVRGTIVCQDWVEAVNLLTGVVGTYVFYERKSGVAAASGYVKHTLTNPVIHRFTIGLTKGGYATVSFDFECKAADETKTIADMWAITDDQAAPTYVSAARGGWRVKTCKHDPGGGSEIDIYHVMAFSFSLSMQLDRACNDADVGYTCVDARLTGMAADGSLTFQDSEIAAAKLKCQQLLLAAADDLQLVVKQSQGGADKTITIANVDFNNISSDSDAGAPFTGYNTGFDLANDAGTPLTLEGDNKIITIA